MIAGRRIKGSLHEIRVRGGRFYVRTEDALTVERCLANAAEFPRSFPEDAVLKDSPVRAIARLEAEGGTGIFVKRYKASPWADRLKRPIGHSASSKPLREWRAADALARRGVPVPECLGFGFRRVGFGLHEGFLLSREVSGGIPFKTALVARRGSPEGLEPWLRALEGLIVRLIEASVFHFDFHLGNVLGVEREGGLVQATVLDLDRTRTARSLSLSERIETIAQIDHSLRHAVDDETRLRFVERVLKAVDSFGLSADDFLRRVERSSARRAARWYRSRLKRCLKESSGFARCSRGNLRMYHRRAVDASAIFDSIAQHRQAVAERSSRVQKSTRKVKITLYSASSGQYLYRFWIKEFSFSGVLERSFGRLRRSKARRHWVAAHGLGLLGIPTPEPVALIEERAFGLLRRSYLITSEVDSAATLIDYVGENFGPPLSPRFVQAKRDLARILAEAVARIHASGVFHFDLKANNFLIADRLTTDGQAGWTVYVLDLDRVRIGRPLRGGEIERNLAQLNAALPNYVSHADRLRFYRAYACRPRFLQLDKGDKDRIARIVAVSRRRQHLWRAP